MQMEIQPKFTEMKVSKSTNQIFSKIILNTDISVATVSSSSEFEMCFHNIYMKGSVSQDFDIGPIIYLRKCRN